jgi:hypothetical protein
MQSFLYLAFFKYKKIIYLLLILLSPISLSYTNPAYILCTFFYVCVLIYLANNLFLNFNIIFKILGILFITNLNLVLNILLNFNQQFDIANNFQTSTRGIKVRGAYPTQQEAELRAKMLREVDDKHDIFVGPVGMWMPWDPEAYKTGRVEYMEEELNKLMSEKQKNESNAKSTFEQRVKESKQKAIDENIKNAEKSGNTLTQTIDEQGNLIGVNNANTQEFALKEQENISSADICNELFEGENIVVGKTDNGQSQLVSGPFSKQSL